MKRFFGVAAVLSMLVVLPAQTDAQPAIFGSDAGMLLFRVSVERTALFEEVIAELVQALNETAPREPASSPGPIRLMRSGADLGTNMVSYIIFADAPVRGFDYSLDRLARQIVPQRAADLMRRLAFATDNVQPSIIDLTLVQAYSPTDALRARLNTLLGGDLTPTRDQSAAAQGQSSAETQEALERLQGPLWSVDNLGVTVAERGHATWRLDWSLSLRNLSLQKELAATVAVDFKGADGSVIETKQTFVVVPVQEARRLSGQIQLAAPLAERVTSSAVRVDPR